MRRLQPHWQQRKADVMQGHGGGVVHAVRQLRGQPVAVLEHRPEQHLLPAPPQQGQLRGRGAALRTESQSLGLSPTQRADMDAEG